MIARVVLYMLWAIAAAQLMLIEVRYISGKPPFTELGYIEAIHSILLAACMVLLFRMAGTRPQQARLAMCVALVMTILLIRENDYWLEQFLPHGAWKWFAIPVAIALLWQCIRHWNVLEPQIHRFSATPAFGVYLAAGSALVFSRLFGSQLFWKPLMKEQYFWLVKPAAQESLELFALGLFLAATLEWMIGTHHESKSAGSGESECSD